MNRSMFVIICLFFMLFISNNAHAAPKVIFDREPLILEVEPYVVNNRTLIPLRPIFEALDCKVDWDPVSQTVFAVKDDIAIKLVIDGSAYINDHEVNIDVPAQITKDHTFVPLRFVCEALNIKVHWELETDTIYIIPPPPVADSDNYSNEYNSDFNNTNSDALDTKQLALQRLFVMGFNNSEESFFKCASEGNLEAVSLLLELGINPNAKDSDNNTALIFASCNGHSEITKLLLARGANINAKETVNGMTPLIWAAYNGHYQVAELLIVNGADINSKANDNSTALTWASFNGHLKLVKLLIEHSAYINEKTNDDWTALTMAASNGHIDTVRFLLDNNADITITATGNWNALMCATARGYTDLVDLLLEYGFNINSRNDAGWTPLIAATYYGHADTVDYLLKNGANMNLRDNDGKSALDYAREKKYNDLVNMFLMRISYS